MVIRVCVVGAGPSGMGTLSMFNKLRNEGAECHVTCYEKQEQPGGLWNLTWRTGTDEYGEHVHCSQYRDLFSNGPKECLEFPDYTFKDHFGKDIPSCPPREVLFDYLQGYWRFNGVKRTDVLTRHVVRNVAFDEERSVFSVRVTNLVKGEDLEREFDRVIVATGHFSVPHVPKFKGLEKYEGRVLHAHDFRNSREFTGQRVLLIGASYSAEDIALQLYKFGAAHVTTSYRTKKMGFAWPDQINEVPLLVNIDQGKTCHFKDGTSGEFDAIILCTGYRYSFPFMPSEHRLQSSNVLNQPNLYRNVQWYGADPGTKDADGKLFYLAMQDQYYTFTMFVMQGRWAVNVIKGLYTPPPREDCVADIREKFASNAGLDSWSKQIDDQTEYMLALAKDIGYTEKIDVSEQLKSWEDDKYEDILTFRDKTHKNVFTGEQSPVHPIPWVKCFDDSLAGYIEQCS